MSCRQIQKTHEYEIEKSLFEACIKHYHITEQRYIELLDNKKLIDVNTGDELVMIDGKLTNKYKTSYENNKQN
tara:strand:+ start:123 stop:341 length:219 start_codon:yes stop_codon:yes gene_type:complete